MNITENKNKKRYVYLDKYEEYKADVKSRLNLLSKVIFWLGVVSAISLYLSLYSVWIK